MDKVNIILKQAKISDFEKIAKIADSRLGESYMQKEKFLNIITTKGSGCIIAYDEENDDIAGFCTYSECDYNFVKEVARGEVELLKDENIIGHIESAAVSKDYRGYHIGSLVIEEAIKALEKNDVYHYFASCWKPNGKVNAEHVLLPLGFVAYREIENYWYEDSLEKGYLCPTCGNPCRCSCVIFTK